ncbi:MAG: hypothetical protein ACLU3I_00510 [Acutalibacteraceae bacterium]
MKTRKSLGIYVHIPFCQQQVRILRLLFHPRRAQQWTLDGPVPQTPSSPTSAKRRRARAGYEVDTVYFGGGTPSFFGAAGLERIFAEIDRRFDVSRDAEVHARGQPRLRDAPHADAAAASRGLQPHLHRRAVGRSTTQLKALGRPHNYRAGAAGRLDRARSAGFDNLSVDLMFGLPNQTREQWMQTLRERHATSRPDHISCYGLKVEPGHDAL